LAEDLQVVRHFFSCRVIREWTNLLHNIVSCQIIDAFKVYLDALNQSLEQYQAAA
jgi:hypothetical protein